MPLYRPPPSLFRQAVGDVGAPDVPASLIESSTGSVYGVENRGGLVESRVQLVVGAGDLVTMVIPRNEQVQLTATVATPGGLVETSTRAINLGRGGAQAVDPLAPIPDDPIAAQNQQWAAQQQQAGGAPPAGQAPPESAPQESAPPPASLGGTESGAVESTPVAAPGSGTEPTSQPSGGCEQVWNEEWASWFHWSGSDWQAPPEVSEQPWGGPGP